MKAPTPLTAKVSTIVDKKTVYICSPFRPVSTDPILRANELIDNLKLAKDACTFAALRGCEPIAPHLYYPQFLNDSDDGSATNTTKARQETAASRRLSKRK